MVCVTDMLKGPASSWKSARAWPTCRCTIFVGETPTSPSLQAAEISVAEVAQLVEALCYQQLDQQGEHKPRLDCNTSHNNFDLSLLLQFTKQVGCQWHQLFAMDLSWNAPNWDVVLPTIQLLLNLAEHADLSGKHLPALQPTDSD